MRSRYLLPILLVFPVGLLIGQSTNQQTAPPPDGVVEIFYGKPLIRDMADMVAELGVEVYPEDIVRAFPDPQWGLGSKITVYRATPIWIDDAGEKRQVRTLKKTVGELFQEKGIEIGVLDTVAPATDTTLSWEQTITITRVEETDVVERQSIPFRTVTKSDPEVYVCSTETAQQGKNGVKEVTYHVRRENRQEVSRKLVSSNVVSDPQEQIILKGDKLPPIHQIGTASWYDWKNGMYAAHPNLPFGTKVYVKSQSSGKGVCVTINDRGPWGPGRVIDLQPEAFRGLAPLSTGVVSVSLYVIP